MSSWKLGGILEDGILSKGLEISLYAFSLLLLLNPCGLV